ncbi:glycine/D-amino acid oxidase-like deaminating enzyme [Actinopolyspora biskrensis]|uniref:Glycine/D-amino acid oxidase-like deaminating enzyme n=1 Tax=Actinopolyspora biskrensis TaxID=1470178 RepID=A0A852YWM9_9ACTN|nr:FAD-binding oxidoreductase [Actinopolyspora biskrensis]NYH77315.1 glycine/D-amino acid oxidase-like deaminating enzyme [Actinopolyspora biskrensis]
MSTKTSGSVNCSAFTGWCDRPTDFAPALEGEVQCDVAVVGGGLAGMASALRLAERGADVVLLEAGCCGWGASSRNAGYLSNALAGDPQLLRLLYRRQLRDLTRYAENSARFTEGLIERLGIDCEYDPTGNVNAAVSAGQLKQLRKGMRILRDAGADVEFVDGRDFGLPETFLGGIFERGGGLLNPGKLAFGLRDALLASGAKVFERTAVRAVEPEDAGVVLDVPGGRVHAERVVLATNAHSRDLAIAPSGITPVWTSVVETEPVDPDRLEAIGWTSRTGIITPHTILENYRRTARGTILFGTRQLRAAPRALGAREPDRAVVADLVRGFHERFPSLRYVAPQRAWGGWVAVTSFLPVAGETAKNVFYAVSCNGHGLAQSPYLGTLLADRLVGDEPHDDLRAVWRPRPPHLPSFALSTPTLQAAWAADRISDRLGRQH